MEPEAIYLELQKPPTIDHIIKFMFHFHLTKAKRNTPNPQLNKFNVKRGLVHIIRDCMIKYQPQFCPNPDELNLIGTFLSRSSS